MIGETELCDLFELLDADKLRQWVAAGLVRGADSSPGRFDAADASARQLPTSEPVQNASSPPSARRSSSSKSRSFT
jgi:hypothetical protein